MGFLGKIGRAFKKVGGGFKKAGEVTLNVATSDIGMMVISKVLPQQYRELFALGAHIAGELDGVPRMKNETKKAKVRDALEKEAAARGLNVNGHFLNSAAEDCVALARGEAYIPGIERFVPVVKPKEEVEDEKPTEPDKTDEAKGEEEEQAEPDK